MILSTEKSPAVRWYPKDIITDKRVIAMTLEQEACYRRLLDFAWIENGLDNNPALLASYCKMTGQLDAFAAVWKVIKKCFFLRCGKWRNKRQEMERKKQKLYSEKQRIAAKSLWSKKKDTHATASTRHMPNDQSGNAFRCQSSSSFAFHKNRSKTDLINFSDDQTHTLKAEIAKIMEHSIMSEANAESLNFVLDRVKKYIRRNQVENPFAYALTIARNLKTEYSPQPAAETQI